MEIGIVTLETEVYKNCLFYIVQMINEIKYNVWILKFQNVNFFILNILMT